MLRPVKKARFDPVAEQREQRKIYRRPAQPAPAPGPAAPTPPPPPRGKKRRSRRARRRLRLVLALCILCLVVAIAAAVAFVRCSAGPSGPAQPDYGTVAAAWQKNELGYYFNASGEAMPAAVLKGIDVSKYQGEVDWEKAKAAGIDFAIIRCGFGGEWDGQEEGWAQDDDQWRRNADECTRLGIPFGVYLYSYATNEEGSPLRGRPRRPAAGPRRAPAGRSRGLQPPRPTSSRTPSTTTSRTRASATSSPRRWPPSPRRSLTA